MQNPTKVGDVYQRLQAFREEKEREKKETEQKQQEEVGFGPNFVAKLLYFQPGYFIVNITYKIPGRSTRTRTN
jgi:hypothetical protein